MAATNFKTENNTLRKLIGNGLTYRIPRFQRDYSWSQTEWEDLWADILATLNGEPAHYMGYLVLQSSDDKSFDVIDGQQRLTTLSLLMLAIAKHLARLVKAGNEADFNQKRLEQIRQTYLGYVDLVTLVARPKLTLNRNNNTYYQNYLVPLIEPLPVRGFRASEHLLRKAFEWLDRELGRYLKAQVSNGISDGIRLAQLAEDISDKLFFTVITVTDELNAYKVFETLNARGVRLSATDLLKNYLFSLLDKDTQHAHELRALEERWEGMVGRLQAENFPDFLRAHWNSRHGFARQADLFKTIRQNTRDRGAAFALLRDMEQDLDTYLALVSPELSDWPLEQKNHATALRTFKVRQPFSLLLAAKRHLNAADFASLLRACVVISMRFNVIGGQSPGEQERTYHQAAEKISQGEYTHLHAVLSALRGIYPDDDSFRYAFAEKVIRTTDARNKNVVRFILCALEKYLSQQEYSTSSDAYNLEHVLPQNPAQGWESFTDEEAEALTYRLGNHTLLESKINREIGNQAYAQKRLVYLHSGFALTRQLAEDHQQWNAERIAEHQRWMAKQATSIWRIAQLS